MRLIDADEFERRIKRYDTTDYADKALYNFAHNEMITTPTVCEIEHIMAEIKEQMKTGESYWQENQIYKRCLWIIKKHIKEKNKNEF